MEKQILHGSTGLCFICLEMLQAGQFYLPGNAPDRAVLSAWKCSAPAVLSAGKCSVPALKSRKSG